MGKSIKNVLILSILSTLTLGMFTGCNDKEDKIKDLNNATVFGGDLVLSNNMQHRLRYDIEEPVNTEIANIVEDGNQQVETEEQMKYEQSYTVLRFKGADDTQYYTVGGDYNNDIIYNGVTYKNLNSLLVSLPHPYDNNTLINFIVKTYDNCIKDSGISEVEITYNSDVGLETEEVQDDQMSSPLSISDGLYLEYEDYGYVVSEYGNSEAEWSLMFSDSVNHNYITTIYGNGQYIIYMSNLGDCIVDLDYLATIHPDN